jgi:hypothetical protein
MPWVRDKSETRLFLGGFCCFLLTGCLFAKQIVTLGVTLGFIFAASMETKMNINR